MPRRSIFGEAKVRKVECRSKRQLDYAETKRKNNLRPLRRAGRSLRPRRPADGVLRRLRPATYRINNTVESPFLLSDRTRSSKKIGHGENSGILRSSMLSGHESVRRCGAKTPSAGRGRKTTVRKGQTLARMNAPITRPEGFRHGNPPVVHAIGSRTKPQPEESACVSPHKI